VRTIAVGRIRSTNNSVAVCPDGCTILVADGGLRDLTHGVSEFVVADGSRHRIVGSSGDGPLQFLSPSQLFVAPDGFVFVADGGNHRVQVLTPQLNYHATVGVGHLLAPSGVCANADVVVVCDSAAHRVAVLRRDDGCLLRYIGCLGGGDGQLNCPRGVCFMSRGDHIAVADEGNHRVSVFSVDGAFICHVGVGVLRSPKGLASSAFDELVVTGTTGLLLFSAQGEVLKTISGRRFRSVAVHGGTVFALDRRNRECVVFE
jgi:DNA-binding beta-propeller fold protein YncE